MVVFKILNKVTGQHYVGSCRGDVFERWELYVRAAEAGLDFPLYEEIRELGEAQFRITELDFCEAIAEVKEMELMYCIELSARSLRNYKYGLKDTVIKRCSKSDLDNAWQKDLPEPEPRPQIEAPKLAVAKPAVSRPAKSLSPSPRPVAAKESVPEPAKAPVSKVAAVAVAAPAPKPVQIQAAAPAAPLAPAGDGEAQAKHAIAEGMGLMARMLACAERLSAGQLRSEQQLASLTEVLDASDRALARLEREQQRAAEQARLALEAVAASQAANQALVESQRRARECAAQVAQVVEAGRESGVEVASLQQELKGLLGRLRTAGSAPSSNSRPAPVGEPAPRPAGQPAAAPVSEPAAAPDESADKVLEAQVIAQQQGNMVNRLKQLDQLVKVAAPVSIKTPQATAEETGSLAADASERAEDQPVGGPEEGVDLPEDGVVSAPDLQARAWVAPQDPAVAAPQLLSKKAVTATVVHRRPKVERSEARNSLAGQRPTLSRKRLALKVSSAG